MEGLSQPSSSLITGYLPPVMLPYFGSYFKFQRLVPKSARNFGKPVTNAKNFGPFGR